MHAARDVSTELESSDTIQLKLLICKQNLGLLSQLFNMYIAAYRTLALFSIDYYFFSFHFDSPFT